MKPFYNLGYWEAIQEFFKLDRFQKRLMIIFSTILVACFTGFLFIYNYSTFLIVCLLFLLCVVSMLPMRVVKWMGFFDMNMILTVYTSINYGLVPGLFVGNASIVGLLVVGQFESTVFFDIITSNAEAFIASFFTMSAFVPLVTTMAVVYFVSYLIFHNMLGTFDAFEFGWATTNIIWIFFVLFKLIPLLTRTFF